MVYGDPEDAQDLTFTKLQDGGGCHIGRANKSTPCLKKTVPVLFCE